jgi:hypothetical protein
MVEVRLVKVFLVCLNENDEGEGEGEEGKNKSKGGIGRSKRVRIPMGDTVLGRGPLLGIEDKRCSRSQMQISVEDDGSVTLTAVSRVKG